LELLLVVAAQSTNLVQDLSGTKNVSRKETSDTTFISKEQLMCGTTMPGFWN
jgi:hypothetical protein